MLECLFFMDRSVTSLHMHVNKLSVTCRVGIVLVQSGIGYCKGDI